jgi:hypothetical protein
MSKGRKKATAEYLDARRSEILGRLNARKLDEAGGRLRTSGISAGRIKEGLIPPTLKEAALLEILIVGVKKYLKNPKIDGLVKSLLKRHPGESRGPEHLEITGFRLSPG